MAVSFLQHLIDSPNDGIKQHQAMTRLFGESAEDFERRIAAEAAEAARDLRERLARIDAPTRSVNVGTDIVGRKAGR